MSFPYVASSIGAVLFGLQFSMASALPGFAASSRKCDTPAHMDAAYTQNALALMLIQANAYFHKGNTETDCCKIKNDYGVVPGSTWGSIPLDSQRWWNMHNCVTVLVGSSDPNCKLTAPTPEKKVDTATDCCKIVSDYGVVPGGTWGSAPSDVQAWWNSHRCVTLVGGSSTSNCKAALVPRDAKATQTVAKVVKVATPDPEPPRMYVAEGCDGSTAIIRHATELLKLHGIDSGPDMSMEMLDKFRNPYYWPDQDMVLAMKSLNKHHRDKNETLVFKSILHRDLEVTTSLDLLNMGTLAVYVTRKNPLDQLVCMVRDCFLDADPKTSIFGYPVDQHGMPSNMCFERRSKSENGDGVTKAHLRVVEPVPSGKHNRSRLSENLGKMEEMVSKGEAALKKAGYDAPRLAYEDMMAFEEGGDTNLKTSLTSWEKLLEAWGVQADLDKVSKYLLGEASTWSLHRQRDSIDNYDEVRAELKNLGKQRLLRD